MTAIDTRHLWSGTCDDGHPVTVYDLILGGRLHEAAAKFHGSDIFFDPPALREWIEADHGLLHAVGEALVEAQGGRAPGRHLPRKGVRP